MSVIPPVYQGLEFFEDIRLAFALIMIIVSMMTTAMTNSTASVFFGSFLRRKRRFEFLKIKKLKT